MTTAEENYSMGIMLILNTDTLNMTRPNEIALTRVLVNSTQLYFRQTSNKTAVKELAMSTMWTKLDCPAQLVS